MGLFLCEECGHVDNTATSKYWLRGQHGNDPRVLCSHCDPKLEWHGLFPYEAWKGELVRNPDLIPRFNHFKCKSDKCSHRSLGRPDLYHLGAVHVCKDCGTFAEVIDVGKERRTQERDGHYKPKDYDWKILHD